MKKIYEGYLLLSTYGDADDILFLSPKSGLVTSETDPLAEILKDDLNEHGRYLTVRYFIADRKKPIEQLTEDLIRRISGVGEIEYGDAYSEITGYLWTDEEINVEGHDLLEELKSHIGSWCYLEIDFKNEEKA